MDISAATVRELTENHPRIAHALRWATLVDEAVLREWMAGLGRREAAERMAHLFCELLLRLQQVGLADEDGCDLPISQADLADILGLTSVHVNRTLRHLREMNLVVLKRRRLNVIDVSRLRAFCDFDPAYLHLTARRTEALG